MKIRALPVIFILGMLLTLCTGCGRKTEPEHCDFFCMDTVMQVSVYPKSRNKSDLEAARNALADAEREVFRIDAFLTDAMGSMTGEEKNAMEPDVLRDPEFSALLGRALSISEATDGAFDPTIYPLVGAWGFYSRNYRVPDDEELEALVETIGWEKVHTSPVLPVLDLGGIGKGYAASILKDALKEHGMTSAILSLGGNISLLGSKPDGTNFTVGIQDPEDENRYFATVSVSDTAVVTSGSYERYFEQDNVRYSHIIDPKTGRPVDHSLLSVTVITPDDVLADALSTALFVMGRDGAVEFYRRGIYDFDMILMEKDRSITITEGLESVFNTNGSAPSVIKKAP